MDCFREKPGKIGLILSKMEIIYLALYPPSVLSVAKNRIGKNGDSQELLPMLTNGIFWFKIGS